DLGHDLMECLEVGGAHVRLQLREERLGIDSADAHQGEDVRLVEGCPGHVALAIEGGKGVELEEDQTLGSGAGDLPLHETLTGGVAPVDLVEEGIADQQEVDLQPREVGPGEIVLLLAYLPKLGQALQGRQGHDQVDVLRVAPLDVLKEGDVARQQVVDPPLFQQREETGYRLQKSAVVQAAAARVPEIEDAGIPHHLPDMDRLPVFRCFHGSAPG